MGIENVKDEVIRKARQDAEKIIAEAQVEAKRIKTEGEKSTDAMNRSSEKLLEQQESALLSKAKSSAELETRKELLKVKKDVIESVFERVNERFNEFSPAQRKTHIAKLLAKAEKEIAIAKVYCAEKDIKNVTGYKAEKADILGGIIAETSDGRIRVDLSYDSLVEQVRADTLKIVSEILFA